MHLKKHIVSFLTISLLVSCESETTEQVSENFVVEAYISANETVDQIRIKETFGLDIPEDPNTPIADAQVVLSKDGEDFPLNFNEPTGTFVFEGDGLQVESGDIFGLSVTARDRTATATTSVPQTTQGLTINVNSIVVPEITATFGIQETIRDLFDNARFILNWDNPDNDNYFIVVERTFGSLPIFPADFPIPEETLALIQSFSTVSRPLTTDFYEIPAVSLDGYGNYTATVYRINQEYVDLFDSQNQDSRDLVEAPSNVDNALGIFTAIAGARVEFEVVRD